MNHWFKYNRSVFLSPTVWKEVVARVGWAKDQVETLAEFKEYVIRMLTV